MIITLLTDFGESDTYVAAMKGVILSRDPRIRVVDLTHHVPPQGISTAAYLLATTFRDFPAGTVHTVVVDPGVGSARAPIACSAGGYYFIGPDNGVLDWALEECGNAEVRRIANPALKGERRSTTFHGRDVFAPAAAALASGFHFTQVGSSITDWERLGRMLAEPAKHGAVQVTVLHIDHFGNLILNARAGDIGDLSQLVLSLGPHRISEARQFYADGTSEEPFLYPGSSGFVEVAVNGGSAAARLGTEIGERGLLGPGNRP